MYRVFHDTTPEPFKTLEAASAAAERVRQATGAIVAIEAAEPHSPTTCGGCGIEWDDHADGTHGPLCHVCHGRGYPTAPLGAALFFFNVAGYSYDPKSETAHTGRLRCAADLAAAERASRAAGCYVEWNYDPDVLSSDWIPAGQDGGPDCDPWHTYCATLYRADGEPLASLGGVDFGRDGSPDDEYARVVAAELASEAADRLSEPEPPEHDDSHNMSDWSPERFADYLDRVGDDYHEAARRIRESA